MIKNICVFISNRANYSSIKCVLQKIRSNKKLNLQLILGSGAILDKYGAVSNLIKKDGFKLTSIIHPKSNISKNVKIGENCFIMQDIHIHPFVKIGNNNFIWSGSIICHHVKIGNNCWFTSGSSVAGQAVIGNNCFFGINSTITNNIKIGSECFIGAQTLVSKNLKKKEVVIKPSDNVNKLDSTQFLNLINGKF